ncbi:NYN domain-containing protein [Bradyrhizobium sp. Pha-3]
MSPASPRIALFIDGPNLYATARTLGFDIDYKRLLSEFQSRGALLRAFYYTAVIEDQEFSSIRPLVDWLDYNGYTVVTKATKEYVDASGRRKVKGDMDIELAVDAMELASRIDEMILSSGNGDFRSLVEAVQRRGVRVTVVPSIASQPPMIADELRRQADTFTDLMDLRVRVGRDSSERPPPRERSETHSPQFLLPPQNRAARRRIQSLVWFDCLYAAMDPVRTSAWTTRLRPRCLAA